MVFDEHVALVFFFCFVCWCFARFGECMVRGPVFFLWSRVAVGLPSVLFYLNFARELVVTAFPLGF